MRSGMKLLVIVLVSTVACQPDETRHPRQVAEIDGLVVYDAYAPVSPAPDIGSLYFTVVNTGLRTDSLTGVRTDRGMATLHEVITEGGLSRMQHVSALLIPPGDTLRLRPGGYHVMLSDLRFALEHGDTLTVTLEFARAGMLTLHALVLTYTEVLERIDQEQPGQ